MIMCKKIFLQTVSSEILQRELMGKMVHIPHQQDELIRFYYNKQIVHEVSLCLSLLTLLKCQALPQYMEENLMYCLPFKSRSLVINAQGFTYPTL